MIGFHLRISNPWNKNWVKTHDILYSHLPVSKHKNFELQIAFWSGVDEFFSINLDTHLTGRDHAGPSFDLTILWFYVSIKLYDDRHWDDAKDCWEVYDE
jgi:hypothetical protein